MVAFYFPDNKIQLNPAYLEPLGLRNYTVQNGVLQADSELDAKQIRAIEDEGFVRADTHWYGIWPAPQLDARPGLVRAMGQAPSTIIAPEHDGGRLIVSFMRAVTQTEKRAASALGFVMTMAEAPKGRVAEAPKAPSVS